MVYYSTLDPLVKSQTQATWMSGAEELRQNVLDGDLGRSSWLFKS